MDQIKQQLTAKGFKGDLDDSSDAIETFSHDASMFEIKPQLIVAPKDAQDVEVLVSVVADNKKDNPTLSVTARSAGTDMSGGAINDSIIVDFKKYFTQITEVTPSTAHAQPGVFYRDFEKETLKILPSCRPIPLRAICVPSAVWSTTTPAAKNRWNTARPKTL